MGELSPVRGQHIIPVDLSKGGGRRALLDRRVQIWITIACWDFKFPAFPTAAARAVRDHG